MKKGNFQLCQDGLAKSVVKMIILQTFQCFFACRPIKLLCKSRLHRFRRDDQNVDLLLVHCGLDSLKFEVISFAKDSWRK